MSLDLSWFEQLSALFGVRDVMKLQRKLYEYAENTMDHRLLRFQKYVMCNEQTKKQS